MIYRVLTVVALFAALSVAGCSKKEDADTAPPANPAAAKPAMNPGMKPSASPSIPPVTTQ